MRLDFTHGHQPLASLPALIQQPPHYPIALEGVSLGVLDQESQQIAGMAAIGASTTASILIPLMHLGAMAGPIGAAVAGVIAIGVALANLFSGCGQSCVLATKIANDAEPILQNNLNTYLSAPAHYRSLQLAALNNFDFTWQALTKACSNPQLQAAGQRCISDRARGACVWQSSPFGWINGQFVGSGPAGSGTSCWNWFSGYRDPIANDPHVVPDPPDTTTTLNPLTGQITTTQTGIPGALASLGLPSIPTPLLVGGAALLGLVLLGNTFSGGGRR